METTVNENSSNRDQHFADQVRSVLNDATAALTENEVLAVVRIRRERDLMSTIESLILEGEVGAAVEQSENGRISWQDIGLYAVTDEERAERQKLEAQRSLLERVLALPQSQTKHLA
jgi:hypothetical protein